jgi:hypothetical protein
MFGSNKIMRFFSLMVMGLFLCTSVMAQNASEFTKRQKRAAAEKGMSKLADYYKSLGFKDETQPAAPASVEEELGNLAKSIDALNAQNAANRQQQTLNDSGLVKLNQLYVTVVDRVANGLIKDRTEEFNGYVATMKALIDITNKKYGSGGGEAVVPSTEFVFKFSNSTKPVNDAEYYNMLNKLADAIETTGAKSGSFKAYGDRGSITANTRVATARIAKIAGDLAKFHGLSEFKAIPVDPEFSSEKNDALKKVVVTLQ